MSVLIKDMEMPKSAEECRFYDTAPFRPYPICHIQPGGSCEFKKNCPLIEVTTLESAGIYDIVEEIPNCCVQILKNSVTGEISIGWYDNDNPPAIID